MFIYPANLINPMNNQVNVGIIGVGRWGTNYFRTFSQLEDVSVKWICATKEATLKEALLKVTAKSHVKTTTNYKDILNDGKVDAVAIASSGSTHYKLAKEALQSEKQVIVEKPLAFNSKDARELINLSKKKKKILMVGHLHRYNPGIQRLKADIGKGIFGKIRFIHLSHFGNGPVRSDMGVIWDFFPHTVSILLYLLESPPLSVSANGASYIKKGIEDVAIMDMVFPGGISAASIASWIYPLKRMNITVIGENIYAAFDDYAKEEKLKYYGTRPSAIGGKAPIKGKGYASPAIGYAKPLTEQLKHFLDCVNNNKVPLTDGYEGLKVVSVLEAAQKSLRKFA